MTRLNLTVESIQLLSNDIRHIDLVGQGILPEFTPGSHIGIEWSPGRYNFYSLTGPPSTPVRYSIAVRLDPGGRGGSSFMHQLDVGDRVRATAPRSSFASVLSARKHLFVAGGIGVTPILSHLRAARQWGRPTEVFYASQGDAFRTALHELCSTVHWASTRAELWHDLAPALHRQPLGTHLYVCGPLGMIDAVCDAARIAGWPDERVHTEPFSSGSTGPVTPFSVTLPDSRTIDVGADSSLLDALLASGFTVPNLCRQGVCGECRLPVRSGAIDHRDLVLTEGERAEGRSIMACVSRGHDRLEIGL